MKKFLLGRFFTGNKLNIIDQQDINTAVFFSESLGSVGTDGINKIICEFF